MEIIQSNGQEERDFIRSKVIEHNMQKLGENARALGGPIGFVVRGSGGEILGGVTGTAYWGHMHIDFLWVDPQCRGQRIAEQLMRAIEQYSRERQYRLLVVDTFSFQAPEFYIKQGFREFGVLHDHPEGHSQHYFEKRLAD
ncbi:ribosomal protein S18 acetylase RimI-like enzyme [Planomicrobium koreense]|uniref:Ribosomal protein S18 acetylase RimI-like enzyme n=1 Tax=Planococcus koreensis TaxID=112331 RepID=A0A7W8CTG2_9BACL|nr:GNAT family N-acetyltransferase [Planococcus koreensis]MBB5181305.1 ribosomal protein S18 acetylase RimI-like enzyme [Planococcus koreensis]